MKFIRYNNLSQQIDTENLYNHLTLLSEVFMVTDDYYLFLKSKSNKDIYFTKESFAGDFDVVRLPFQSWGITTDRQELLKFYSFKKLSVDLLAFKINPIQYLTLICYNDHVSISIDNTDNSMAMNFIHTSSPLLTTKSGDSQTIFSFNSNSDGTNSSVLYSTDVTYNDGTTLSETSLESMLSTITYSRELFTSFILDMAGTTLITSFAAYDTSVLVYLRSLSSYQTALDNQIVNDSTQIIQITLANLNNYLNLDFSNHPLVFASNNVWVFYNADSSEYIYKNFLAYIHRNDFTYEQVFLPTQRYNLFKDTLTIFYDVTDVSNMRVGKIVSPSLVYTQSNVGTQTAFRSYAYQQSGSYLDKIQSFVDIISLFGVDQQSELFFNNYKLKR